MVEFINDWCSIFFFCKNLIEFNEYEESSKNGVNMIIIRFVLIFFWIPIFVIPFQFKVCSS